MARAPTGNDRYLCNQDGMTGQRSQELGSTSPLSSLDLLYSFSYPDTLCTQPRCRGINIPDVGQGSGAWLAGITRRYAFEQAE